MAVLGAPATSLQAFTDWRETLHSDRLIPIASTVKVAQPDGSAKERPSEGRILGIAVPRDFENNGKPFHSWANQPVQGIDGPNRSIDFTLTDGAIEGQEILAANGSTILRGQTGIESAIASGGFVYVGTEKFPADHHSPVARGHKLRERTVQAQDRRAGKVSGQVVGAVKQRAAWRRPHCLVEAQ
jgi:hypothetical protein